MQMPRLRIKRLIAPAIIIVIAGFWCFYIRSAAPTLSPSITWRNGAPDFAAIVHVTRQGQPVAGYHVGLQAEVGLFEAATDSSGIVRFSPNQSYPDIVALQLANRWISLRPVPGGRLFLPSCFPYGLTFEVSL